MNSDRTAIIQAYSCQYTKDQEEQKSVLVVRHAGPERSLLGNVLDGGMAERTLPVGLQTIFFLCFFHHPDSFTYVQREGGGVLHQITERGM